MKQTKEQFVGVTYDELLDENAKLREMLAKAGELIVIAEWPNVERDEMASAVMHDIRELGVEL